MRPEAELRDFLDRSGWRDAAITPIPGDASTRHYARIERGGRKAMLMDQPQDREEPAAPADATPQQRREMGYNAIARLAGADVGRFVAVAKYLYGLGLSAPDIYAADTARGLVLLEDLGDALYADALTQDGNEAELYRAAADVLAAQHQSAAPALLPPDKPLHDYDATALLAEIDLLTQWYFPLALGRDADETEIAKHRDLWRAALDAVRETASVFVHRDYHAQNLLWMPDRQGLKRVGLIDFQDAVAGTRAYDLISLTEDARRDVPAEIARATTQHYLDVIGADASSREKFFAQMAVMAAQRNAKIVGIFARLSRRDGKPRYLSLLPRVWGHLNRDLEHPALIKLKSWYDLVLPPALRGDTKGVSR